ncbi:MAG: hypothetical protein ACYCWN_12715 [Ferrimicrobium sp.]|jgi:hypothetical protein|uniref:Uncharacterized protein n=1 Tax=Ferrimicrobium acidiphilum TaxID=121039 RepID=A0ABV3Y5Q2_9ACTN|nr:MULTISPECIES: hypothetical protein [Ferrimicrobium]
MDYRTIQLDAIGYVIGLLLLEVVLLVDSVRREEPIRQLFVRVLTVVLWLGAFLLLATPTLQLTASLVSVRSTAWAFAIGSAVLVLLLVVARFLADTYQTASSTEHFKHRIVLLASWIVWGFLAAMMLSRLYPFHPRVTLGLSALAAFGIITTIVSRAQLPEVPNLLRIPLITIALLLAFDLGVALIGHVATLRIELGPNQKPSLATATNGSPGILNIQNLRDGVLTSGLGQSDQVLQLNFHGFIRVTKPNFQQLVTLAIHGKFGDSRTQSLLFRARGVPQPGGSLAIVSSLLKLTSASPQIKTTGRAKAVLADAIFGTLYLHHQNYAFLLTYEPTGLYIVSGSITLWPQSPQLGRAALE